MGGAKQIGFGNERELESTSDGSAKSAESDRKLESLGAMGCEWARKRLCACCGWVTGFVSLAKGFVQEENSGDS